MPHDGHDHGRDHGGVSPSGHPYRADQDGPMTYWQVMETAIRELMIEKGVTTPAAVQAQVEVMDARSPAQGARVVARAWTDPGFRDRLLADGSAACGEIGIEVGPLKLIAVENGPRLHNVVVCTLCSCYPAQPAGPAARLVQVPRLPHAGGARATRGPGGVRDGCCRTASRCGSTIRRRTCGIWSCRCAPRGPKRGTKAGWRVW